MKNKYPIQKKMIKKIISNLPNQESISKFKDFVYKYGKEKLSKVVNTNLEKKLIYHYIYILNFI